MPRLLRMPAPAAGVHSAVLIEWAVEENVPFVASDVLAVIETDKAVLEIEADAAGVIHTRLVPAGIEVEVGSPIAVLGAQGDSAEAIAALVAEAGAGGRQGAVAVAVAAAPAAAPATSRPATEDAGRPAPLPAPGHSGATDSAAPARIFASPIARRMARDADLAITDLAGTGPGGRIVRRDVEAAVTSRDHAGPSTVDAPAATQGAGYTDTPHSRIRAAIAARLTDSKRTVPHFYLRGSARVDALLDMRRELNTGHGQKISVNDLVLAATARAHRAVPEMNVIFIDSATRRFDSVDVAVAIATDSGLLAPVLRAVDRLTISQIATATADFGVRARQGRIRQQELDGGTITVTNLGMFGVEEFAAIINPPQSAILAVGAARQEPVAEQGALAVATVMRFVLSVDHRPLDGVTAASWMSALTDLLEHPVRILA